MGVARAFGRRPAKEPFPFQEILPLALKDSVSGKGERTNGKTQSIRLCVIAEQHMIIEMIV